jgi:hypothetical protein
VLAFTWAAADWVAARTLLKPDDPDPLGDRDWIDRRQCVPDARSSPPAAAGTIDASRKSVRVIGPRASTDAFVILMAV